MALSGKLTADFATFETAVASAELRLTRFEAGGAKVESALNKMANSFTGTKVIAEATLMAEAIERIGGTARLTEAELTRVGNVAAEAASKLRAWGQDVPERIQALAAHAGEASSNLNGMIGVANQLAGALGVAFSVQQVVNFGAQLFEAADRLQKLADKTGLSTDALQRIQVAGDDAGNTIDQLAGAIDKMEARLASGNKPALEALQKLGLTFDDLRGTSPEEKFDKISEAIRGMTDPAEQLNAAIGVFGRQGEEILPTLKRGFDDVRGSAVGMSRDTVKAMDDVGDAFGRMKRSLQGDAANLFSFLFLGWGQAKRDADDFDKTMAEIAKRAQARAPNLAPAPAKAPDVKDQHEKEHELAADLELQTKHAAAAKKAMEDYEREEMKAFEIGLALWTQGNKLLDEQNAKMAKRLELQTAFVTQLILEKDKARDVNVERNLGPAIADPALEAATRRDKALEALKMSEHPEFDFGPLIQKIFQDFDEALFGKLQRGTGAVAAGPAVQVNVSGVWDPATVRQLTDAVSEELMRRSGRKF